MKKIYQKFTGWNAGTIIKVASLVIGLNTFNANAQYCAAGALYTADEEIYNVMVNGAVTNPLYSFTNGCSTPAPGPGSMLSRYSNFMSLGSSYTVTQGVVSTFSVAENECDGATYWSNGAAIWIDYNQDGDFVDAGEQIYTENALTVSPRNMSGTFIVPFSAVTGTTVMRVIVCESYNGVNLPPCPVNFYYGEAEDYVVTIAPGVQCAATPPPNTIVPTTTLVCPVFGTSQMTLATTYTVGGINYQWMQSTGSAFGPWVNATGTSTQSAYNTPTLAVTTWYQLVANCVWGGSTNTVSAIQVNVASTTTNSVPYLESFEGITLNGQLPNCSWTRSDNIQCATRTASVNNVWRMARTGTKFAEFDNSNQIYNQTRYFYSNGIQLNAGITYSATVWYANQGNSTWYNLGLLYGPSQTPAGLTQLATIAQPANTSYMPLTNTFQVPTTGLYYMAIRGTENGWASQTVFDDLSVIAPCQFTNNAANINFTGNTTICAGQAVNITASGASTYTWTNGPNTSSISVSPAFNTIYTVSGTNPLTGCVGSGSREIIVNQLPPVSIVALKTSVCEGESVMMQAFAGNSYTWSAGPTYNSVVTVTPSLADNTYTVLASNVYGCVAQAVQQIAVNPLPAVTVAGNSPICVGTVLNLTANGAGANGTYEWKASNLYLQSNPVSISPNVTTTYSVIGTSAAGCKGQNLLTVAVDICLGIENISGSTTNVSVYPNPNAGIFTVSLNNGLSKTIEVVDVTGRIVLSNTTINNTTDVNISTLANGVYYVKVKSDNVSEVIKVVKQ